MINTQMGLTPISPQSHNLLEIGECSRTEPVQETAAPILSDRHLERSTGNLQAQLSCEIGAATTSRDLRTAPEGRGTLIRNQSGRTLTKRVIKTGAGTKVNNQPSGMVQQPNSPTSFKSIKGLRSMKESTNSLKSIPIPSSSHYLKS